MRNMSAAVPPNIVPRGSRCARMPAVKNPPHVAAVRSETSKPQKRPRNSSLPRAWYKAYSGTLKKAAEAPAKVLLSAQMMLSSLTLRRTLAQKIGTNMKVVAEMASSPTAMIDSALCRRRPG